MPWRKLHSHDLENLLGTPAEDLLAAIVRLNQHPSYSKRLNVIELLVSLTELKNERREQRINERRA